MCFFFKYIFSCIDFMIFERLDFSLAPCDGILVDFTRSAGELIHLSLVSGWIFV